MTQANHDLPRTRRCQLLGIHRSGTYYQPKPVSDTDQVLMKQIDWIHMAKPFLGSRRIVDEFADLGQTVNLKRVSRLMRLMGIQAIHPGPKTSQPNPQHKIYPYLLRNLTIDRANQVWASGITYIPMETGFIYLTVVMDWYSRKVLSWRLSNSLDSSFCVDALEEAIHRYGKPDIFNSDQGSQFTSTAFTETLLGQDIRISMDGKGAWRESLPHERSDCFGYNVFVERLWRSVKYEEVYLKAYESMADAKQSLKNYFEFYNQQRKHQTLKSKPDQVYYESIRLDEAA
jgi:putative transposase